VGARKLHATFALIAPSFSLFAFASCHSGSAKKAFHFFSRSAMDSQANMYVRSLASGPTRVVLPRAPQQQTMTGISTNIPEPNLLDAVLLPDPKSVVLESSQQIWHPARDRGIDSEFVYHLDYVSCVWRQDRALLDLLEENTSLKYTSCGVLPASALGSEGDDRPSLRS
jgi:hypothetical protein